MNMKLSIGMVAEVLQDLEPICHYQGFDSHLNLERCIFFDGVLKLYADTLYIFTEKVLEKYPPMSLTAEAGAAILYLGYPEDYRTLTNTSCIYIEPEKISAMNLSNRVQECFERYRKIDMELRTAVRTSDDIMRLIKAATPLFHNELTIRDRLFRYVAHSYRKVRFLTLDGTEHEGNGRITPVDEINSLKLDPLYREQISTPEPWPYRYGDYNMWCYDIFINHLFVYRIKLINTNQEFRPWDPKLFHYFCQIFSENLAASSFMEQDSDLVRLFQDLLDAQITSSNKEIDAVLKKINWNFMEQYLLLCLRSGVNNGKINPLAYYCTYLPIEYPDTFAISREQNIVLIVNLSAGYQNSEYIFLQRISPFLRDENFRAGISFPYTSLTQTRYAYQQALMALQKGTTYDPEIWLYHFKNYRYHYLFGQIFKTFPEYSYILPELKRLERYDKENRTDFMKIFKYYLKYNRNMLQTAKALNMHRSTLAYQLKKIEKIMDCDFDDSYLDTLFQLVLQFLEL